MKIFSKPSRIGTPGIDKASKPLPSPNKLGQISAPIPWLAPGKAGLADDSRRPSFSSLASGYSSTSTLVDPSAAGASFLLGGGGGSGGGGGGAGGGGGTPYSTESSPTPLIDRGFKDSPSSKEDGGGAGGGAGGAKKEKSHHHRPHFLMRPRDKEHHGTFSSSSSNSKIADPAGSLYSFGPSSPGSSVFDLQKSISGMDMIASSASLSASKTSKTFKAALGSSSSASYEESLLAADLAPAVAQDPWPVFC